MGKNKYAEHMQALEAFIEDGTIDDVIGIVKSGKEANVYCCSSSADGVPELVAAKVYRSTDVRQFANDAVYRQGRWTGDRRAGRAIAAKSRAGREFAFGQWVAAEYEALRDLHRAGVHVPRPIVHSETVVLMEFVGDEDGPAALLAHTRLGGSDAASAFNALMQDIELMLACDRVHGDLSPFNVLYDRGTAVIIDLPQAVDARFNSNALDLLERDIARICVHFERQGVTADARVIARQMWSRFLRGEL